jgi:hypothetical protein
MQSAPPDLVARVDALVAAVRARTPLVPAAGIIPAPARLSPTTSRTPSRSSIRAAWLPDLASSVTRRLSSVG